MTFHTLAVAALLGSSALASAQVAPGQAAVLYDGDRVLGGGWIAATEPALAAA